MRIGSNTIRGCEYTTSTKAKLLNDGIDETLVSVGATRALVSALEIASGAPGESLNYAAGTRFGVLLHGTPLERQKQELSARRTSRQDDGGRAEWNAPRAIPTQMTNLSLEESSYYF